DWMLRLPSLVAGGTLAGLARVAVAVVAGAGMLLCFAVAAGFGWRADGGGDAESPLEEEDARGSISLGRITHGFLSLKARVARGSTRGRRARARGRGGARQRGRTGPCLGGGARATRKPTIAPEGDGGGAASPPAARKPRATPRSPRRSSGGYVLPSLE